VLNICFYTLVSDEKKDDNAATTLALLLIYGCDKSGPIGYLAQGWKKPDFKPKKPWFYSAR
jgi:hypothetical protein